MGLQNFASYIGTLSDGVTPTAHPIEADRNLFDITMFPQGGVIDTNNGNTFQQKLVSPGSANLQVAVSPFHAFLKGTTAGQGGYHSYSDNGDTVSINAPSANNRIDTLLLNVGDPEYGTVSSGRWGAKYAWATGTAGTSPVALTDVQIAAASVVPGAWLPFVDVLVTPADASRIIPSASITRRWPYAYFRPKSNIVTIGSGGNFSATGTPQTVSSFSDFGFPRNAVMYVTAYVVVQAITTSALSYTLKFLQDGVVKKSVVYLLPGVGNTSHGIEFTAPIALSGTSFTYKTPTVFSVTIENTFAPSGAHGGWNSAVVTYRAVAEALAG